MRVERGFVFSVAVSMLGGLLLMAGCRSSSEMTTMDSDAVAPDVVATYADLSLTLPEFEARYAKAVGGRQAALNDSLAQYEDFLGRYVDFRLKVTDAIASGVDKDSALVAELTQYRKQLARPYIIDRRVTTPLVDDLYEKQKLEVTASHILIRVPGRGTPEDTLEAYTRAQTLRDSVLAGADFNDIAERNSDDPSAERNRGHLGTFTAGRLILAFEDQAYKTEIGSVSEVFRTRFGYHMLMVHDRGPRQPDIGASHILIRVAEDDTVEAWETILELQGKLAEGADFAELAREYSTDPGSAPRGGDLGTFGKGRMVPAFEEAAFGLKDVGDVSDPVRTRFGYHLIKLNSISELPTYEEAYDELKQRAERLPRFKAAERELGHEFRQEIGSTIDSTAVDSLTAGFAPDSVLYRLSVEDWDLAARSVPIAELGATSYTLGDLTNYGMANRQSPPSSYGRDELYRTIGRMLDEKALDNAAETLEERDSTFADLMTEYRDGIVLFRVMEDSVWNLAAADSVGLRTLYEAKADSYRFDERSRIVSFYASSDSLLGIVAEQWTPGTTTDWSLLFEEDDKFRMDTTFVADSTNSVYDRVYGLPSGATSGPTRYRSGYILLAVDGIEEPRAKTFDEARADVLGEHQARIEETWLERLRERYNARLYPEHLAGAFGIAQTATEVSAGSTD